MSRNEDFMLVLGRISIHFATLDFVTTSILLRLIRRTGSGPVKKLSDRMTLQQKLVLLRDIDEADVTNVELLLSIRVILPDAIAVGERRNRFTHDQWVFSPATIPSGYIRRLTITGLDTGAFSIKEESLSIQDLNQFENRIKNLQVEFGKFLEPLGFTRNRG